MRKIKYLNFPCLLYIFCIILVFTNLIIKVKYNDFDDDDKFYGLACFILNIVLIIYFKYYHNYLISLFIILLFIAFFYTYLLLLKEKTGRYFILSIPFFILLLYILSYLINYYTNLSFLTYLKSILEVGIQIPYVF